MIQNIANGRLNKFFKESCLMEQEYVQDSKLSVGQFLEQTQKGLVAVAFKRASTSTPTNPPIVITIIYSRASGDIQLRCPATFSRCEYWHLLTRSEGFMAGGMCCLRGFGGLSDVDGRHRCDGVARLRPLSHASGCGRVA